MCGISGTCVRANTTAKRVSLRSNAILKSLEAPLLPVEMYASQRSILPERCSDRFASLFPNEIALQVQVLKTTGWVFKNFGKSSDPINANHIVAQIQRLDIGQ